MAENEKRIVVSGISLRRDLWYNYQRVGNKFIPKKGEVCLVDTQNSGLRALIGDGVSTYNQLSYIDTVFVRGYYFNNTFWDDAEHTIESIKNTDRIYIDLVEKNVIYYYDGNAFVIIGAGALPYANSTTAGILKLYETTGTNTDGTMTQKAITEELEKKIETSIEGETIFFY